MSLQSENGRELRGSIKNGRGEVGGVRRAQCVLLNLRKEVWILQVTSDLRWGG